MSRGGYSLTVSRTRPFLRRAATIARPARVRMRSRKPWTFARRRLFGWYVRLLTAGLQGHVRKYYGTTPSPWGHGLSRSSTSREQSAVPGPRLFTQTDSDSSTKTIWAVRAPVKSTTPRPGRPQRCCPQKPQLVDSMISTGCVSSPPTPKLWITSEAGITSPEGRRYAEVLPPHSSYTCMNWGLWITQPSLRTSERLCTNQCTTCGRPSGAVEDRPQPKPPWSLDSTTLYTQSPQEHPRLPTGCHRRINCGHRLRANRDNGHPARSAR